MIQPLQHYLITNDSILNSDSASIYIQALKCCVSWIYCPHKYMKAHALGLPQSSDCSVSLGLIVHHYSWQQIWLLIWMIQPYPVYFKTILLGMCL